MEKQSKNIDTLTENIVKEGGLHQPPSGFFDNVMNAISTETVTTKSYKPLVSTTGWVVFGLALFICLLLLYIFPVSSTPLVDKMGLKEIPSMNSWFSGFKMSKTLVYGIGFLALFLVQIPFLKRILSKQYLN